MAQTQARNAQTSADASLPWRTDKQSDVRPRVTPPQATQGLRELRTNEESAGIRTAFCMNCQSARRAQAATAASSARRCCETGDAVCR